MSGSLAWLVVPCVLIGSLLGVPATANAAEPVRHTFTNEAGSRDYLLFVPEHAGPVPLVVFLHGCGADPLAYGLDEYAADRGFAVALPIQSTEAHAGGCWRWTADTSRGVGEASIIAGITQELQASGLVAPARTYLAGHSAGSSMTAKVAASYPDLYAAVGMIAGCGFRSCADTSGRSAYSQMGERAQPLPAYVVWGTDDRENPYVDGRVQLLEWLALNDLADDGKANLSTPRLPSSVELRLGRVGVPTFSVEHYRNRTHCADVDFATGFGMGHVPDFDWPSVFPAMLDFLLGHPAPGC